MRRTLIMALVWSLVVGGNILISYGLATVGESRSVWLWSDVLGVGL